MRYIPNSGKIAQEMLDSIGKKSYAELFSTQIPESAQFKGKLKLPEGLSEVEIRRLMFAMAEKISASPKRLLRRWHLLPLYSEHR